MDNKRTLEEAKKELGNNLLILENKNSILLFERDQYAIYKKMCGVKFLQRVENLNIIG